MEPPRKRQCEILRVRAADKGIGFKLNYCSNLPERIQTDDVRFRQVIANLAGNAIKFTAQGGVEIQIEMRRRQGQNLLHVTINDSGIGMNAKQFAQVFQPFVQADSSVSRRFGGTGLGLTISKNFVTALGGEVSVTSKEDVGSSFTFWIDAGECQDVEWISHEQFLERNKRTQNPLLNDEVIELREELEKSVQPSKTANCFGSFCVAEPARIVSTLPMDDPEMREIASELVVGLKAKLAQMRESTVHRNFDELIPAQLYLIERLASSIEVPSGYCGVQN